MALYASILRKFPHQFAFCFAYGSAVKPQTGIQKSLQMVDLLFTVDNSPQWHRDNLQTNSDHYSSLKYFGADLLSRYQERLGAKVYFNTLIPLPKENVLYKYGVVTKDHLVEDLIEWKFIYLAGRLHKPVEVIIYPDCPVLVKAIQMNLSSAVRAALLLLPEHFSEYELFHTISNLSYSGDFRMIFGENKNKVKNIVKPQLESFNKLYSPILKDFSEHVHLSGDGMFEQNVTSIAKLDHLSKLPLHPKTIICESYHNKNATTSEILKNVSEGNTSKVVHRTLQKIVWQSSVRQSIKGIFTAGLFKSLNYSVRKIKKMF